MTTPQKPYLFTAFRTASSFSLSPTRLWDRPTQIVPLCNHPADTHFVRPSTTPYRLAFVTSYAVHYLYACICMYTCILSLFCKHTLRSSGCLVHCSVSFKSSMQCKQNIYVYIYNSIVVWPPCPFPRAAPPSPQSLIPSEANCKHVFGHQVAAP